MRFLTAAVLVAALAAVADCAQVIHDGVERVVADFAEMHRAMNGAPTVR